MALHKKDWLKLLAGAALVATGAGAAGIGPLAGALGGGAAGGAAAGGAAGAAGAGAAGAGTAAAGTSFGSLVAPALVSSGMGLGAQGAAGEKQLTTMTPGQVSPLPEEDAFAFFQDLMRKSKGGMK